MYRRCVIAPGPVSLLLKSRAESDSSLQVHIVTDELSANEELYKISSIVGTTQCDCIHGTRHYNKL